jgi:hypothetical protein
MLFGLDFFADNVKSITAAFIGLVLVVCIAGLLLVIFRDTILTALFKTAETRLEALAEPVAKAVKHAAARDSDAAIDSGKEFVQMLLARHAWLSARRWMMATIVALLAGFAGLATSVLMFRQNELLSNQNAKLDAQNLQIEAQTKLLTAQNDSMLLQTKIAELQVIPQFTVTATQSKEPGEDKASQDKILIDNLGAVVQELDSEFAVFLYVELFFSPPRPKEPIRIRIPVNGYYTATGVRAAGKGQMLTIHGNRNNEKLITLDRAFGEYAKSKGMLAGFVEVERYIRLSYRDGLGNPHLDFYFVQLVYGARLLTQGELTAEQLFDIAIKWPEPTG